jgi:uroporphyrinogen-III decarboxylase
MRQEQWSVFKNAAKRRVKSVVPLSLIVDSPWMPGYLGLTHHDYYFDPEVWFCANLRLVEEFPDIIMFPSWWVELGMAIEPSAIGARINFWLDKPPNLHPLLQRLEEVDQLPEVDPTTDGLMAMALQRYRSMKARIKAAGYTIPVVAARGPLCTAAFLRGLTFFMMDLIDSPEQVRRLLDYTTGITIKWLQAQAVTIGESVEGVFVLDDIVGFLSREHYLEFADSCLRRICDSFPEDWVKVYHNDANVSPFLEDLAATGFDVLNWGKKLDIGEVRERLGQRITLMGNVNPLEIGVNGTPDDVRRAALDALSKTQGQAHILSLGGGVSPGMPKANVLALLEAWREFTAQRAQIDRRPSVRLP